MKKQLKLQYPESIDNDLKALFRYEYTRNNIYALINYIFNKIYISNDRWSEIPSETIRDILGDDAALILKKISNIVKIDHNYSYIKHECKRYTLTNSFIKLMGEFNHIDNFKKYLGKLAAPEEQTINQLINQSTLITSNLLGFEEKTYSISLLAIDEISTEFYESIKSHKEIQKQAIIQSTKNSLKRILTDDIHTTISEKNGRHYDDITRLMKEVRKNIMKKSESYVGQLDLKCCHGFIVLNILKDNLTPLEYNNLYELFKNPILWNIMMDLTGIKTKEKVKSKFQLFMNGSLRDNRSNPIYKWFSVNHSNFTNLLFQFKLNKNLSNEINMIEASIMHSDALKQYIEVLELNCDTIHDCLWIYGKGDIHTTIGKAAQYIIYLFKSQYNMDMVFTLEIEGKPKVIVDKSNVDEFFQLKALVKETAQEIEKKTEELQKEKNVAFHNRKETGAFNKYYDMKHKLEKKICESAPLIEQYDN